MHVLVNTQRKSQRGGPSADLQSFLLLPLSLLLYSALWTPDILIFPNSQVHLSPIQGHCWTQPGFHNYVLWSENSPAIMLGDHRIHFIWFPSFRDNCLTLSAVHHLKAIVLYFFLFVQLFKGERYIWFFFLHLDWKLDCFIFISLHYFL